MIDSALEYSDKVCLIDEGEVVAFDTPEAFIKGN